MKKDYVISLLVHLGFFALIIIFSASTGKAKMPKLGGRVTVSMHDNLPKGLNQPQMPNLEMPSRSVDTRTIEAEPVKLASITKKEKLKPKPKPKPKEEKKPEVKKTQPKEQPKDTKPPEDEKVVDDENQPSGSSIEYAAADGSGDNNNAASGPLGEYYLSYDFGYAVSKIKRNWNNPVKSNSVISCVIYFQVTKDGEIQGVVIKESSGNNMFDKYAEMAVKGTSKLPSLPQSFPDNEVLTVNLTFSHRP
jgi:TonB family protein